MHANSSDSDSKPTCPPSPARDVPHFLKELAARNSDGILIVDPDGIVRFANPAAEIAFGCKTGEMAGPLFGLPMMGEKATEPDLPGKLVKPDHVELCAAEVELDGKPAWLIILRDISQRRSAEERTRLLAHAVQSTSELISITDLEDRFIFINEAFLKAYGLSADEVLSKTPEIVRSPRNPAHLLQEILDNTRAGGWRGELFNRRKDGTEFPIFLSTSKVLDDSGRAVGLVGVARNITESKRIERELRQALDWQEAIFEGSRDAIFISDADARFISVNRAACELTGYTRDELLSMAIPDLHSEEDRASYRVFHSRIMQGEEIVSEASILRKNGTKVEAEFNNRRIIISNVRYMHTVARDVTERKEALEERKRLQEQLLQAQKMEAIGQLAGGVAHDFNNLLTVIIGYADALAAALDEPLRDTAEQICKAGERAAALTAQLLAFSRKQMLQPKVLDLNIVISESSSMLQRLIGENIVLVTFFDPALGCIKADPSQISQVIMNLALNARDSMPNGGTLTIQTKNVHLDEQHASEHIGLQPGDYVVLSVRDTGTGMDPETQSRIFEPFFTTKDKTKGTGLGLSTVYGIVRQSDGYITVESQVGKGSYFRIYMPRIAGEAESRPLEPQRSMPAGGSETILVVEDERMVRELSCSVLRSSGYNVLSAEDGHAALALLNKHEAPLHLLLTDVVMPGLGGREVATRVVARHPETAVIFMSGYTDDTFLRSETSSLGAEFLQKPFPPSTLILKVKQVLSKRHGNQPG